MNATFERQHGAEMGNVRSNNTIVSNGSQMSSLAHKAYRSIKESIMKNEFKPGDCLSENALAQALGMSRTPIREAIKVLSSEGLIEIHNGVGAFIKHITIKEIHDIFEVRSALECIAVDSALARITKEELEIVEKDWQKLYADVVAGRPIGYGILSEHDSRLHELIVVKCDNDFIINIIAGIRMKIARFQKISATALGDELDTINQHLALIKIMKSGNAEALKHELKAHILLAENLILKNPNVKY
jgi:DNA-binding GntR family transcriptional regulator